jgi:SAM-dependent methyltransferase
MTTPVSFTQPIRREFVLCDLCGSNRSRPRLTVDLNSVVLPTVWVEGVAHHLSGHETLVECAECGLVYVNPRLVSMPGLVPYSAEQEATYFAATRDIRMRAYTEAWRQVSHWLGQTPGSLLDIGCGDGVLLETARDTGARVVGTEVSDLLIAQVRQRLGAEVVWAPEAAPLAEASFDVVTLFNVIEHLHSPRQMLAAVVRWVRPGGVVLIHVPNFGGWPARWAGARWHQIEPFAHYYYFTAQSLGRLLRMVGLTPMGRFNLPAAGWRGRLQRWTARFGLHIDNGLGIVARREEGPPRV